MRKKMKWHRFQEKREHMLSAQWRLEKLREVELQKRKVVGEEQFPCELESGAMMFETSVEDINPYDFKVNNLCMFVGVVHDDGKSSHIVIDEKEGRQNFNFVLKEDETTRSHVEFHTPLKEYTDFHHIARSENRGILTYINIQKRAVLEEDIKHTNAMLEEADREILLLENMLREFDSRHELKPQVNNLSFSDFDEEMRFHESCIGKEVNKKDSTNLEGQKEMSQNNDKEKDSNEEEDGEDMSHIDEKTVLEPKKV